MSNDVESMPQPHLMESIHDSNIRVKLPHHPFSVKTLNKRANKHKKHHTNNTDSNELLDEEQIEILKEKKKQTMQRIEHLKALLDPKLAYPKYPYLQLPYRFEDPIADPDQYKKTFHLPGKICPLIYKIDPKTTSIEQLELEKKIMKQKIKELIAKKSAIISPKLYESKVKKKGGGKKKPKLVRDAKDKKSEKSSKTNKQQEQSEEVRQEEEQEQEEEHEQPEQEQDQDGDQDELGLEKEKTEFIAESIPDSDVKSQEATKSKTTSAVTIITSTTPLTSKEGKKEKKKENSSKKKIYDEERIRLYTENLNRQIERENCYNLIKQNIKEKKEEINQLYEELEQNKNELKSRLKEIRAQLSELETNIEKEVETINSTRIEFSQKISEKLLEERKNLRLKFEQEKQAKRAQIDAKKAEVDYVLAVYPKTTSLKAVRDKKLALDEEYEEWINENELKILEDESELFEKINDEEDTFFEFINLEEENIIRPLRDSKAKLESEEKQSNESFEIIQEKISKRIKQLEEEVSKSENEKITIEITNEENIRIQTERLNELLQIEREAKEKIREELENYREGIMKIREKNLKLKYDLTMLKHMHGITRAYVFSYFSNLTIYKSSE